MPVYSSDALILRTYKLGEADRIVVFLTRDRGKKRGVARGARRSRSRFTGGLEPLTRGAVAYFEREQRELVTLNYVEPARSPLASTGGAALAHASYFAELIDEWAQEGDPNEKLYRLGASMVDALVAGAPTDRLAPYFEYWVLRLQGVYPSVTACPRCGDTLLAGGWFAPRDRVYVCRACGPQAGGSGLSAEAFEFLRQAPRQAPEQLADVALTADAARELEKAHRMLISAHLDREPRSLRVLREMR